MASDGSGMLVVVAGDMVQVWHVGTMTLLRQVDPFEEHTTVEYHGGTHVRSLSMRTVIHPIEDVLGPGEGTYYNPGRQDVPQLKRRRRVLGYSNPLDLTECTEICTEANTARSKQKGILHPLSIKNLADSYRAQQT